MNGPPRTMLLVEDDPNDVLLIQRAFRKAGVSHSLQVVGDGEQAAAYLLGQAPYTDRAQYPLPTLMLLDLKLPRKTGLEVLAWLREQTSAIKRLPVIVLTSSRQSIDINLAYDLGANSYLVKPGEFDALLQLTQWLNRYWIDLNENPDLENRK
jgi:CheY-like chemotaxis protein